MSIKTIRSLIIILSAFGFLAVGCSTQSTETIVVDPAFSEYVSAYTSGEITRTSNIYIRLNRPVEGGVEAGSTLPKKMLSFEPELDGEATWVNDRMLEFKPKEPMPSGQVFTANFDLAKYVTVPDSFSQFRFQFKTIEQEFEVKIGESAPYRNDKLEWQKVYGRVILADFADSTEVAKMLVAKQGSEQKNLNLTWISSVNNVHHFTIDSVARSKKPGFVTLSWNGSAIGVAREGNERIEVPALGDFRITNVEVIHQPEQYIELHFSDPIKSRQNLEGIIELSDVNDLTFAIEGNRVSVYPPARLSGPHTLKVSKSIRNNLGYKMAVAEEREIQFELIKPEIRLVGTGNILPNSNGLYLPFEAVSLNAVDVEVVKVYEDNIVQFFQTNRIEGSYQLSRVARKMFTKKVRLDEQDGTNLQNWNRYFIDLSDLVADDPGAIFQVRIKYRKDYSVYQCEATEEVTTIEAEPSPLASEESEWSEREWNDYYSDRDYWYDYDYDYRQRENPCNSAYYRYKSVTRNVLASDLGLVAKAGGDKRMHVMVNNLLTTEAIAGATVEFYDYQQQLIGSVQTDGNGMAETYLATKPFVAIAKHGSQRGYVRLRDGDALSMSKFDVSGSTVQKGVKGLIYTERGVWRPGDSLYVSFMLEDKTNLLPPNHPVSFEFVNPQGQVIEKRIVTESVNHLYDFRTATDPEAPTGNYTARIKVGNRTFSKRLKVETVKPNRLKIYLDFGKERLTSQDGEATASLNVKWLHGAIARNLKTRVEVSVSNTTTKFKKFHGYSFDDPSRTYKVEDEVVFDDRVNDQGTAEIPIEIGTGGAAPGMLKASFTTRVFEEGGGFSIDRNTVEYSPYDHYVGVRVPEGNLYRGTLVTDQEHKIEIASVTDEGKAVSRDVEVKVYKLSWRWWWDRYDDNLASYLSRTGASPIMTETIRTKNGKANFDFRVNRPNWGRYLVYVTDPVSGHTAGKIFYVDWPYWARGNRTNNEFATMLNFSADKEKYGVGEKIKVSFPSSEGGHAIVCVETGTKVLKKYLIDTEKGETRIEIPVSKEMTPNVFVHVALLQPHSATANDLPIRMYGVVPIEVEDPATRLHPVVSLPSVLRPESTINVKVNEQEGRRMTYTLAMVDEGLLDLTRFKTPDPHQHFYAKEALGVRTWDMYDDVIGAWTGEMDRILSIGGDGANETNKAAKANRFKPVVKFLGPFELEAGATDSHKINIPNYVGSVRVMVVAGEHGVYGHTEKTVPVRNPLMVLATLPRVLGPKETVQLPVNVFAMEKHVKDVTLEVVPNEFLKSKGALKQTIHFDEEGDKVVNFEFEVANMVGIGKVKVIARSGRERATHEIELDVRTPNPRVAEVQERVIPPGQSWTPAYSFDGIAGTNRAVVEVSSVPAVDFDGRLQYLLRYPHGCIEQTTSSVFPQLFVDAVVPVDPATKTKISTNVKAGIQRLLLFQTPQGGFGYWPGNQEDNHWGTNYGGHFLLEAERKGYPIPSELRRKWVTFQRKTAREYRHAATTSNFHGLYHHHDLTQAYRLYVLALADAPELGAMNRLREADQLSLPARWRLAAAYQLVGQPEVAKDLVFGFDAEVEPYQELSGNYGSDVRDQAMILETLSLVNDNDLSGPLAVDLIKKMNDRNRWMNTQTTAYCLIGISRYLGQQDDVDLMEFTMAVNGEAAKKKKIQTPMYQMKFEESDLPEDGKMTFSNSGQGALYVKVVTEGIPVTGDQSSKASNVSMQVRYTDMGGKTIDPTRLAQGTDFIAEVTVTNPGTRGTLREMALNQVFPSGWEIHNTRMDEVASSIKSDQFDYQDIRDDRVYTYYYLSSRASKTFRVKLNATYRGRYYLPSITTDAMYDNTIHARRPGQWVEVVKADDLAQH